MCEGIQMTICLHVSVCICASVNDNKQQYMIRESGKQLMFR